MSNLDVLYVNIMEARNFITAREMLTHSNWIHTTLNLEPRYEKPPLPTWLTAMAMWVFGKNNLYGLRLPAVISVIVLVFASFKLMTLIVKNNYHAFVSSLVLATSFYIVFSGRNAQWDIFAHSFMMISILLIYKTLKNDLPQYQNALLAGFFMGLSILSKGPVSLYALFLPFIFSYAYIYRFKGFYKQLKPTILALILALTIGSCWAIYIYITDAHSVRTIAAKETLAWSNRNVRSWYYYWNFFIQSGMWSVFALIGLLYPFMKKRVANLKAYQFTLIWTLSTVVLLSLIPEKKSRYLLPVLIPLAFNTSFYVHYIITKAKDLPKLDKILAIFGFGLFAFLCFIIPVFVFVKLPNLLESHPLYFWLTTIALFSIGLFFIRSLWQSNFKKSFYLSITMMCSLMLFSLPLLKGFYNNAQFNNLSHLKIDSQTKDVPLFVKGYIAPELLWEFGEPIDTFKDFNEITGLNKFGVITQDSLSYDILKNFNINLKQRIDINYIVTQTGKGNNRLITQFYLLEKKQDSIAY